MKEGLSYMLNKHPYLTVLLTVPLAIAGLVSGLSTGIALTEDDSTPAPPPPLPPAPSTGPDHGGQKDFDKAYPNAVNAPKVSK